MLNRGDSRTLVAIVTTAIVASAITSLLVRPDNARMHDLEIRVRTLEIAADRNAASGSEKPCDPGAPIHGCK